VRIQKGRAYGVGPTAGRAIYNGTDAHTVARELAPGYIYTLSVFTVNRFGVPSEPISKTLHT